MNIIRQWATLDAQMADIDVYLPKEVYSYEYTDGIRLVISVKLDKIKRLDDNKEIKVPENKEKLISGENAISNNNNNVDISNSTIIDGINNIINSNEEINSCIVYDSKLYTTNNKVEIINSDIKKSNIG